jgi:glycosyltransferase 2 family protein
MDSHPPLFSLFRPIKRVRAGYAALLLIPGLYWLAFKDVDASALLSAMAHWRVSSLGVLGVLNLLIVQAMCLRWGLILKRAGHRVPFSLLVSYRLGANAVSYLTPGPQIGGEPLQVHWLARFYGVPSDVAAASVVVDRIVELIANSCFLLLAGIVLLHGRDFDPADQVRSLGLIALLCLLPVALFRAMASGRSPMTRAARFCAERFGLEGRAVSAVQFVERGEKQAASILNAPIRVLCLYGGCAAIQWLLMLTEFWFIYRVLGVSLSLPQLMALMGAARLAFLLPLPGALGVLEAGQLVVLDTLNIDPVSGLAACLIMRARDLVLIGTGAAESIHRLCRAAGTSHR